MILISTGSPQRSKKTGFQPEKWLWLFTGFLLPLFLLLGIWQLNRATEKEQFLAGLKAEPKAFDQIQWSDKTPLIQTVVGGYFADETWFLLDNKIHRGQFGYEVFRLLTTAQGNVALSLGWIAGSQDRSQLPSLVIPDRLPELTVTLRMPPKNPLLGVDANIQHDSDHSVWIVQSLTTPWVSSVTGKDVLGFAQLNDTEQWGVGPVIWQPTVMTPTRHRAYALQWFAMAVALAAMFVYAGFRHHLPQNKNKKESAS